jgi:betaine-aldehyde dehydrogenase
VFNLVPGGKDAGAALASHPDVAKIALIGSVPTGKAVMRAASDTLKGVLLELGGKNALIAYPDADPDAVAGGLVGGMNFTWCGQSCGSTSRAFIHEKIYDAVLERVKVRVKHWKPGIPTDPSTTMGAIISKPQFDRVMRYIDSAKREGARLVTGGGRPSDPALAKGLYIEPTVFADVTPTMTIAREEIFGPVVTIIPYQDDEDAIRIANDTEYGLASYFYSRDNRRIWRAAERLEYGMVGVNTGIISTEVAPFGGMIESGIGREGSKYGIEEYVEVKYVALGGL